LVYEQVTVKIRMSNTGHIAKIYS